MSISRSKIKNYLAVLVFVALLGTFIPLTSFAVTTFGGKITKITPFTCLLPAPPPLFSIPVPGLLITVGLPMPTVTFFVPGVSKLYRFYALKPGNWTLGFSNPIPWMNCPPFSVDKEGTNLSK